MIELVRDEATNAPVIVTEYIESPYKNFRQMYDAITPELAKKYIFQILTGLHFSHSKGIMHRDIKPHNLMVDPYKQKITLIDWGLGEFYIPGKDYHCRVASRYFKGPELLTNNNYYHYSLDIWSLGCLMAGIIFKREPFFKGKDNIDQLVKIAKVVGTKEVNDYIFKYNLKPDREVYS